MIQKINHIGIAVRRDICFHGMALNVDPDLDPFCWVDPCGLEGVSMTSMQQELDKPVGVQNVKRSVIAAFAAVFNVRLQPCDPADMNVSGVDIDEFQTRVTQTPLA